MLLCTLRRALLYVLGAAVFSLVLSQSVLASSVVVTPPSTTPCKAIASYSTISLAISSVPTGSTIFICPGTYAEQVVISKKNLTLKGVAYGNSNAAIITAPAGGMVTNATSTYSQSGTCNVDIVCMQVQILVQNATVTIEDLTLDASGSNLETLGCYGNPVGIFFQNASGTITRNSVLNDILSATTEDNLTGCQSGLGIYVESGATTIQPNPSPAGNSTVNITYNNVANYQKNGITGNATNTEVTISNNVVVGQGPWGGAGQNSIQIAFGATGSITSNTVGSDVWAPDVFGDTGDAATGILVYGDPTPITIHANNVSNTQYGIWVGSDGTYGNDATVTNNVVTLTHLYDAIDLCSNGNTAMSNTITGADESGIHIDDTCGVAATGNTVSSNTINGTCVGVLSGPASGNTIGTNTYYNAVSQVVTGSDTCTPAPTRAGRKPAAKPHWRVSPAKP
jgi:hypothetical protein